MWVHLLKFIHIICVLGLISCVGYCIALSSLRRLSAFTTLSTSIGLLTRSILALSFLAMITGTLLVYPKHFTFHTAWIRAAYAFLVLFLLGIFLLKKHILNQTSPRRLNRWFWPLSYAGLIVILFFIIQDAVTKSTFLF